jgi:hypothetical protein
MYVVQAATESLHWRDYCSIFSEERSGRVMFLSTRPEGSVAVKAPQQETTQDAGELPKN